jgi:hypothetical protein
VLFVTINVGTVLIIQIIVPPAVIVIDPLNPVAYVTMDFGIIILLLVKPVFTLVKTVHLILCVKLVKLL